MSNIFGNYSYGDKIYENVPTLSYVNNIRNSILAKRAQKFINVELLCDGRNGKSSAEGVPLRRAGAKTTG